MTPNPITVNPIRWIALVSTLGSGCAMALTGPAAELGMTIGRLLGFRCLTSENSRRQLILAAAGAGMTANFDTPLTGVFYAMEINRLLIKDRAPRVSDPPTGPPVKGNLDLYNNIQRTDIIALFLATATSSMMCRGGFMGQKHFLAKILYKVGNSPSELWLFCLLGMCSGLLAHSFEILRDLAGKTLAPIHRNLRPIIGGAACSLTALFGREQSFGSGFNAVARIAGGVDPSFTNPIVLLKFIVEKTTMISLCTASGQIGGSFAHALFTGTALGALFRNIIIKISTLPLLFSSLSPLSYIPTPLTPFLTPLFSAISSLSSTLISSLSILLLPILPFLPFFKFSTMLSDGPTYAVLGLAGTIAAFYKSPMTACVLVLEMTKQIDLVIPLLITAGAAALTSNFLAEKRNK